MKLTDPIFRDAEKAREWFESQRWPNGPICPHCGNSDQDKIASLGTNPGPKGKSHRPGLYKCYAKDCRKQFTVQVKTVMERSHVPLNLWALAMFIMASSKKGTSARQMARMMGLKSMKTIWFLTHRIREAMKDDKSGPLGGADKAVEADEGYFGGRGENRAFAPPPKKYPVLALVERDGRARSFHITNVTAKTLKPIMYKTIDRASYLMTDDLWLYRSIGRQFAAHATVRHKSGEYARQAEGVRAGFYHTNTVECFFSLCKRAVFGAHHSISEAHLHRYCIEWDFKFSNRKITDGERTALIAQQAEGKRLMYQRPAKA